MPEHSPEPWRLEEAPWREEYIVDANGSYVTFDHPTSDDGHRCSENCGRYREQEAGNRARAIACVNACRLIPSDQLLIDHVEWLTLKVKNAELVPELVACLQSLLDSHQELLERCLLHDAFLNHAQQLGAGMEGIRAKELLAKVKG
jgi:hypothetical protein